MLSTQWQRENYHKIFFKKKVKVNLGLPISGLSKWVSRAATMTNFTLRNGERETKKANFLKDLRQGKTLLENRFVSSQIEPRIELPPRINGFEVAGVARFILAFRSRRWVSGLVGHGGKTRVFG